MFRTVPSFGWIAVGALMLLSILTPGRAEGTWPVPVAQAVVRAGGNRAEIEAALETVPPAQLEGMEFLVANMPDGDLRTLSSAFLLRGVALAYQAWIAPPWKGQVTKPLFLNDVLPYACLSEPRDGSKEALQEKAAPLVAGCRTPGEAAQRLNEKLFPLLNVRYSTERQRPDQSPSESIASGKGSGCAARPAATIAQPATTLRPAVSSTDLSISPFGPR